jgi:hypothetical protein
MSDKEYLFKREFWFNGNSHLLHEMGLDLLLECGYNSAATGCQCIGHHKTDRNEAHFRMVNQELERRGESQLEYFSAAKLGKFNGKGAY